MATVLKTLLVQRNLESHPEFLAAYDRCAAELDPPVPPGHGPAKAQYYQWLSGRMIGLPRSYHRRVLARMFPDRTVESLFRPSDAPPAGFDRPEASADAPLAEFLGAEMWTAGVTLVYATHRCERSTPREMVPGVPEDDLRAMLHVSALLQREAGVRVTFRAADENVADLEGPVIAFGLRCVPWYLREARSRRALVAGLPGRLARDTAAGYGIIARVCPGLDRHPDRYCFLCAGAGPRGTARAGRFLAEGWTRLHRRAGGSDFLAVVAAPGRAVRPGGIESEHAGHQESGGRVAADAVLRCGSRQVGRVGVDAVDRARSRTGTEDGDAAACGTCRATRQAADPGVRGARHGDGEDGGVLTEMVLAPAQRREVPSGREEVTTTPRA